MRKLSDVVDQMLEVIPIEEASLAGRIKAARQSSLVAAPEMQPMFWNECFDALISEIGEPTEDWQKKVAAIFGGV
jgi:hypothetical protein